MRGQMASGTPEAFGAARQGNAMAMARYYRPELDVLRCFAFLMVFASHTVPVSTAAGGAFGVDLFFTLSSFLITTLLLRESSVCGRSEEHTSELQSHSDLVCRLLLE